MSFKDYFFNLFGSKLSKTNLEESVINEKIESIYYKELAIQTAINIIANAISKCEIKTYENNKEVQNTNYYILNVSPNLNENSSQLWHKAVEKMIYENEAILVAQHNNIYCADSYCVDENVTYGNTYRGITIDTFQMNKSFKSNEVIRLKLNNRNVTTLINTLNDQYGDLLGYTIASYKKSNGSKYKLILDQVKASDENFQKTFREVIQKQVQDFVKNDNAVYPQYRGYDLVDMSPTKSDSSDFRNLRKELFEIVAQAFNIPISLMFGNVTNIDEVVKVFLTFCVDPIAELISEELTRKVYYGYHTWKKGNYIKVDTSTINHIDILDVAEKADKLISSGTCCIDEVRTIIGFDKLNTDFSTQHFVTKNYDTVENRLIGDNVIVKGGETNEE